MPDRLAVGPRVAQMRLSGAGNTYGHPFPWLAAVAAAFTFVQLVLVVPGSGLGWDETVYVSQVSRDVPAAFFSAPRARGISYLVAPVATLTSSTAALHVYLALCSGFGLFVALWVWRRLLPPAVLAAAGAMFAGLWITLYYGPMAMPNLWCALGSLAAVGCFLRAVRETSDGKALAGLGAGVVLVALMRPSDACYLVLPLVVAALAVPGWRRPAVPAVLVAALLLGSAPWIIEAQLHYGGVAARLHRASEIQGGLGRHLAVDDQIRALDGRTLCRPCEVPWKHPVTAAWWFALPLFTAGGIVAAGPRRPAAVLATLVAASMATPYLFMIDYAAPGSCSPPTLCWRFPSPSACAVCSPPSAPGGGRRSPCCSRTPWPVTSPSSTGYSAMSSPAAAWRGRSTRRSPTGCTFWGYAHPVWSPVSTRCRSVTTPAARRDRSAATTGASPPTVCARQPVAPLSR